MSRWDQTVTETKEDALRFWSEASLQVLYDMMDAPRWAWERWLEVAAAVITSPGHVLEAGCGIGLLTRHLPAGCTYYGCDINPDYIREAGRLHGRPGVTFEHRDLYDLLDSGERFDWVLIPSLFGMFPEGETYRLIESFWPLARRGMSVTTVNKRLLPRSPRLRFEFTGHDPGELLAAARRLPSVGRVQLIEGRGLPEFKGHTWSRGLVLYAWRDPKDSIGANPAGKP
jgi:SAM-dependent methyltransferase